MPLSPDQIDGYLLNWKGHTPNCLRLEDLFTKTGINCSVINCDEAVPEHEKPNWIHLSDAAYFTAQFSTAVDHFSNRILLCCVADAQIRESDVEKIIQRTLFCFSHKCCGVLAPNDAASSWARDPRSLTHLGDGFYEVPITDCTLWAISEDVVAEYKKLPRPKTCYGWGIDAVMSAVGALHGKPSVRDYTITITQPPTRGYNSSEAMAEMAAYAATLPPPVREEMERRLSRRS